MTNDCRYEGKGHGPCGGPSNGRECWWHMPCTKGLKICGHQPATQRVR